MTFPPTRTNRGLHRVAMLLLLVACGLPTLLAASGCQSAPPPQVTREDMRHIQPEPLPTVNPDLPRPRAVVYITQIALAADLPTDPVWEVVDEEAFPQVTRSVWNANGLRVGMLGRDQLGRFTEVLPVTLGRKAQKMIASEHPTPIRAARLYQPITVDLTMPPLAVDEQTILGGRAQLLLSVGPDLTLYLTPHHYKPQARLVPVDPLQRELDGRIYHELALAVGLARGQVLVVGLHRPWPLRRTKDGLMDEPEPGPVGEAVEVDPYAKYDLGNPPPLPAHLGRALLTGSAAGGDTQVLMLMTLDPLSTASAGLGP